MRIPLILGKWKMNKKPGEAAAFLGELRPLVAGLHGVDTGVAPPFVCLPAACKALAGSNILLGAQNCHGEESGAFTGEVSPGMLLDLGCSFAILGHSERRQFFGETDEGVRKRAAGVLKAGMTPVVCVGETLGERDEGRHFSVVEDQVKNSLAGFSPEELKKIAVAYEPVWAIGTGRTASNEQAQEMHAHIRKILSRMGGEGAAAAVRILYGGSVNPQNAASLLAESDVDGALVGGASLDAQKFASIARFSV